MANSSTAAVVALANLAGDAAWTTDPSGEYRTTFVFHEPISDSSRNCERLRWIPTVRIQIHSSISNTKHLHKWKRKFVQRFSSQLLVLRSMADVDGYVYRDKWAAASLLQNCIIFPLYAIQCVESNLHLIAAHLFVVTFDWMLHIRVVNDHPLFYKWHHLFCDKDCKQCVLFTLIFFSFRYKQLTRQSIQCIQHSSH